MGTDTVKHLTRSELAEHLGCSRPYVTKLANTGRVVFADEAKRLIDLAATMKRIEETADLARSRRAGRAEPRSTAYHAAQTRVAEATADLRTMEARRLAGDLIEAAPTLRAIADLHQAARNAILEQADRLASQLAAETDPLRVHELLRADGERICQTMQGAAARLAGNRERNAL